MNPFFEVTSKTGKLATINLNYVIRFEPHGSNTDIWLDSASNNGETYYLAVIDYELFKQVVSRVRHPQ